jgi:transglutaminase-like putative cysteine protease
MNGIREAVDYVVGATDVQTTAGEALRAGHGVCQDHAHVFMACARLLGVPARYVSGYLVTGDGEQVFEASHAWAEAHIEDLGWVAFDPANAVCATDRYVRVAVGRDYRDAAPTRGVRRGVAEEHLEVSISFREVDPGAVSQQ